MTNSWASQIASVRRVGFDTNALIYFLEGRQPYASYISNLISMMEAGQVIGWISTIVEMELLVKPMRDRNRIARDKIEVFVRGQPNLLIRSVDRSVARRAADVRARTRLASLDAIIVATSLEEHCDAIVGNDSMVASRPLGINYIYLDDYIFE